MADNYSKSLDYIDAVRAARDSLKDLYRDDYRDPRLVARLNADLGDSLKLADVHATLAVVEELRALAQRPATVIVDLPAGLAR